MKIPVIICFLVFAHVAFAQKGIVESFIPQKPIVVDGKVDEWENDWLVDSKGKFAYNVANDDQNFYFRLKITDDQIQTKVGLFGLYLYLSGEGKKVGKKGIKYPMGKDPEELKAMKPPETAPTSADLIQYKKDFISDAEALELIGFAKEHIVSSRLGLMNGIEVMITADVAGDYTYEGKIPFKSFGIKRSTVKTLGVSFQTGRLKPKSSGTSAPMSPGGFGNNAYNSAMRTNGYAPYYGSSFTQLNEMNIATTMLIGVILK